MTPVEALAQTLSLGDLLIRLGALHGGYELLHHHKQGEFHHDVFVRVADSRALPGPILVVSTNCNGGVKEVLSFGEVPEVDALWHQRCPEVTEFEPLPLPEVLAQARTHHWFDPCALLTADARSELRPEHRQRQRGGGWVPRALKR